jgi:peptidoglycan LD-endopeptidase LytH
MPKRRQIVIVAAGLLALVAWSKTLVLFAQQKEELLVGAADFASGIVLPYRLALLKETAPPEVLLIPIPGLYPRDIEDTYGAPRPERRTHEGIDIFAERGTPLFAVAPGYVVRTGFGERGGIFVYIYGEGGLRHYYAHLERLAEGIERGAYVTTDTVIGFVGTSGNAEGTPPHLHYGLYTDQGPINPYALFKEREE